MEISAKLESELAMEKEMRETDQPPDHIREYMENTEFKIQDTAGQEEVTLTRTFGDEKYVPTAVIMLLRMTLTTLEDQSYILN